MNQSLTRSRSSYLGTMSADRARKRRALCEGRGRRLQPETMAFHSTHSQHICIGATDTPELNCICLANTTRPTNPCVVSHPGRLLQHMLYMHQERRWCHVPLYLEHNQHSSPGMTRAQKPCNKLHATTCLKEQAVSLR